MDKLEAAFQTEQRRTVELRAEIHELERLLRTTTEKKKRVDSDVDRQQKDFDIRMQSLKGKQTALETEVKRLEEEKERRTNEQKEVERRLEDTRARIERLQREAKK